MKVKVNIYVIFFFIGTVVTQVMLAVLSLVIAWLNVLPINVSPYYEFVLFYLFFNMLHMISVYFGEGVVKVEKS